MTTKVKLLHDTVGIPTGAVAVTQSASDNTTKVATTAYVTTALANLADSAPSTLNTLNELAAALGDDANFSTTVTNSIAAKLPLAGGTLTGDVQAPGVYIGSTNTSYDLYNNGTTYLNGSVVVDDNLTVSYLATTSYIDLNNSGNRGKIGWSGNHTYIATSSSVGSIIFKNNVGSTASPQTGGDTLLTIADGPKVGIGTTDPSGILSIPATDTTTKPQIRFMTTGATNLADAALSTTDDSGGTNLLIGSNQYYSGGSIARFDTSRSGTAIDFGYTGKIKFFTGSGNAAPTLRMQIDALGKVGIGTGIASNKFGIKVTSINTDERMISLYSGTTGPGKYVSIGAQYSETNLLSNSEIRFGNEVQSNAPSFLAFATGSTTTPSERMRITSGGDVSIGSNHDGFGGWRVLNIRGASANDGGMLNFENSAGTRSATLANQSTGMRYQTHIAGGYHRFETNGNSEAMRIIDNGNVGVGNSNPPYKLSVSGTGGTRLMIENTNTNWAALDIRAGGNQANYIFFKDDSAERARIQVSDGNDISFHTGNSPTQRVKINAGGDVAVGDASNGGSLTITGSGTQNAPGDGKLYVEKNNNADWSIKAAAGADDYGIYTKGAGNYAYAAYDHSSSAYKFRVNYSGTIYAVNTSVQSISDRRLKENIVDANSQWDDIKALKWRNYSWKESSGHNDGNTYLGLIADEVKAVSPKLVEIEAQPKEDIEAGVNNPNYENVKYSVVWLKAMKALQEAMIKIETLETKLEAAEARITTLEG